ncbi:hypothetical protein HN018_02055 [Lichenicola cladoniae]|uniref:Uncharacterized protein n=1 Tax=Lichenicola cladoniae TaxID=1484109 RepID=A0A6M8HHX8_9PROT|nr:hypothetical protein [Lichenicola cladoniae]NPD68524.1 hypothetical protein [Acetobacteraceae bacterium]QKE88989.1 hypothetical protein HN018_02055 [Lichenicola cladoniae]
MRPARRTAIPVQPTLLLAALLAGWAGGAPARAGSLQDDSLLRDPGSYSLEPPSLLAGGVVSQSFGSGGYRSSAIRMDSGLLGGKTRAFVELGTGQGPRWHGRPVVSGSSVAVGVETEIARHMTLSITGGAERDRFGNAGYGNPNFLP